MEHTTLKFNAGNKFRPFKFFISQSSTDETTVNCDEIVKKRDEDVKTQSSDTVFRYVNR